MGVWHYNDHRGRRPVLWLQKAHGGDVTMRVDQSQAEDYADPGVITPEGARKRHLAPCISCVRVDDGAAHLNHHLNAR